MSFYSLDYIEDENERLHRENKLLNEKMEELKKRDIIDEHGEPKVKRPPLFPGGFSAAVTGFAFMAAKNSIITYLTGSFLESFLGWFAILLSSIFIFTVCYYIFDAIFEKIDKISQNGAYFSANRSAFKSMLPTLILVILLVVLALLSVM